jgi:hypothetical protein
VISLVRNATVECSFSYIAIPLLLLSGRRSTEIMNGKSEFMPSARSTTAFFKGQLKRRGADTVYEIPLLCDYTIFAYGISVLRAKQRGEQLEANVCNNRYHKMLNTEAVRLCPQAKTAHALRGMYAAYVFHLYFSNWSFNKSIMRILGHDELNVSLSYNSWSLHNIDTIYAAGCMGILP